MGREFCHGHAGGDFSLHATLPLPWAEAAQRGGWAEPHYLVHAGQTPPTVMMLYAPRDDTDRVVILQLVRASYEFALAPLFGADAVVWSADIAQVDQETAVDVMAWMGATSVRATLDDRA